MHTHCEWGNIHTGLLCFTRSAVMIFWQVCVQASPKHLPQTSIATNMPIHAELYDRKSNFIVKYLQEMPHIVNWLWWTSNSMPCSFPFLFFPNHLPINFHFIFTGKKKKKNLKGFQTWPFMLFDKSSKYDKIMKDNSLALQTQSYEKSV